MNTLSIPVGDAPPSLHEAILRIKRECARMKRRLLEAHEEIERLQEHLAEPTLDLCDVQDLDFRSLRRRVLFHCHPDRGGDARVMREINQLFNFLEHGTS